MYVFRFAMTLVLGFMIGAAAQTGTPGGSNGRLTTIDEALQSHHIELTKPALVKALRNQDAEVRSLAAQKLAEQNATETIPAILDSLTAETMPGTRVNIAFSLAQLGEARGFNALQDTCRDPGMRPDLRVLAARYMRDLKHEDAICRSALVDMLQSPADPDARAQAASLLPRFQDLSPQESQKILQGVLKALEAPEPTVRLAASHALNEIGDKSAISNLQKAVANEPDKAVRSQLQMDLQELQQKKNQ
jgi:HEAT repeat protein